MVIISRHLVASWSSLRNVAFEPFLSASGEGNHTDSGQMLTHTGSECLTPLLLSVSVFFALSISWVICL